ncbi:MAG: DUF2877 domain-containing protein [Candidatus Rokubacteria bacterium]|nr:DUF2877 domain-containing protein [Candidatus Rokubacteria bacterium]
METIRASGLTAEAARRLRLCGGTGRVHSAFARTVNLELDGLEDLGWLSLHGPGLIPSAFGIACDSWKLTDGLEGASVRIEANAIALDGRLLVRLETAGLRDTTLQTPAPLPAIAGCLARALSSITGGLLPVIAHLLADAALPRDPLARKAYPALAALYDATRAREAADCVGAARWLLGLGPGLTPAGDDCLVGWLAGVWVAGPDGRSLVEATAGGLSEAARTLTGPLSRAFLAAAVSGQAAEPLYGFVSAPNWTSLARLLSLGATSGADLLGGYLLGRAALAP